MEIIKAGEPIQTLAINVLIYGDPGIGKTSLASTANNPILLDFDGGVHRSQFRKDAARIKNWSEIIGDFNKFLQIIQSYSTIVIDTVDTMLDYIGVYVTQKDPKLLRNKLQFYGAMRDEFTDFVKKIKTIGKDIIFIAHAKEKDEGDFRVKRPAITGGSYDRVMQVCDLIGYYTIEQGKRSVNFSPTDTTVGKNSVQLERLDIPNFNEQPNFFAGIMQQVKDSLNNSYLAQQKSLSEIHSFAEFADTLSTIEEFNNAIKLIQNSEDKDIIKKQKWNALKASADKKQFKYDAKQKVFFE